ncbi:hypothetical protein K474DRAFT_1655685 [Panus rudis PR-1116 ss-1]|nr:hypothetical protein K474DRAFT_1655685 [Panus rudis PR-1116 ss-1]
MPVKDLVGLYEKRSQRGGSAAPLGRQSNVRNTSAHPLASDSSSMHNDPPSTPARFLVHPTRSSNTLNSIPRRSGSQSQSHAIQAELPPHELTTQHTKFTTVNDNYILVSSAKVSDLPEMSSDVTDEIPYNPPSLKASASKVHPSSPPPPSYSADYEMSNLAPNRQLTPWDSDSSSTIRPRSPYRRPLSLDGSGSLASTSTAIKRDSPSQFSSLLTLGTHEPVPVSVIFARNAAPLYLPDLDERIEKLPPPVLPAPSSDKGLSRNGKGKGSTMFPPMDVLAASGKTVEDLEHNAQIAPGWRNRNTIFGILINAILGFTGSSALASFYSLHGLFDTLQIFALILNTIVGKDTSNHWRKLIFGTIPNILAFNLATSTVLSLILLLIFMIISGILLYFFYRSTSLCCRLGTPEGLQKRGYLKSNWSLILMSFVLTVLYLPISTMALHVLVWSEDLWVVPNPYVNATSYPPVVPPLGPQEIFRDPLDFCWTTTMKRNQVNFAPLVVIIAIACVAGVTVWFPIHLRKVIQAVAPRVDHYTELGTKRSGSDMNREYQRLLARDANPLNFLYGGFRRGWATYESIALFAKLVALALTAVVDPDNCLFRSLSRDRVAVARQILLLLAMLVFFLMQCFLAPFLDPVNNASEWTSRANYVVTSAVSLGVALNIPGKDFLNGPMLYIIYVVTYGLSLYFSLINAGFMRRAVKRLTRRIDFSIDIFSPRIDLSPSSNHPKRRIWQESITTLLLTNPECGIPKEQQMIFAQAIDSEYPPYLLEFLGTPGERHVENLKILREIGSMEYTKGVALMYGPDRLRLQELGEIIQLHFVGPDCYWKNPNSPTIPGCRGYFGHAWWIPFPPTIVIHYDDGPTAVLRDIADVQLYLHQNSSPDIQRRRQVRLALRALSGKVVKWPYDHIEFVGSRRPFFFLSGRRYQAQTSVSFRCAMLRLKQRGDVYWEDFNLGSGFQIELNYAKNVTVDGTVIGLNDDFDLTKPLARFLLLNEDAVKAHLPHLEAVLERYRHHFRHEGLWKSEVLTYRFLTHVYNRPQEPTGLAQSSIEFERDQRVKQLMLSSEAIFEAAYARLSAVTRNEITTWWYIFWDDLWRRNNDTIKALQTHATDFNPWYPTSIAYTPLPRAALEAFLTQRGLLNRKPKFGDFFHAGFLNKMYLRMYDVVFHGTKKGDIIHIGDDTSELNMEEVDEHTQGQPSTLGTGGGTDHDDESIRPRPMYRWEGILGDKLSRHRHHHRDLWAKFGVWFGITPRWRAGIPTRGLALDVALENGRYVLLRQSENADRGASSDLGKVYYL